MRFALALPSLNLLNTVFRKIRIQVIARRVMSNVLLCASFCLPRAHNMRLMRRFDLARRESTASERSDRRSMEFVCASSV